MPLYYRRTIEYGLSKHAAGKQAVSENAMNCEKRYNSHQRINNININERATVIIFPLVIFYKRF